MTETLKPLTYNMQFYRAVSLLYTYGPWEPDRSNIPTMNHYFSVASSIPLYTDDIFQQARVAALLHDMVEDNYVTFDTLREYDISSTVIETIDYLTRRDGEVYFKEYLPRLMQNDTAVIVKVADAKDNLRRCRASNDDSLARKYVKVLDKIHNRHESIMHSLSYSISKTLKSLTKPV